MPAWLTGRNWLTTSSLTAKHPSGFDVYKLPLSVFFLTYLKKRNFQLLFLRPVVPDLLFPPPATGICGTNTLN